MSLSSLRKLVVIYSDKIGFVDFLMEKHLSDQSNELAADTKPMLMEDIAFLAPYNIGWTPRTAWGNKRLESKCVSLQMASWLVVVSLK